MTPAASPASSQFLTQIRNPFPPSFAPVPLPKISAQMVQGLCSLSPPPGGLSRPLHSAAAPCHAPSLQRPCHQQTSSCAFRIHPEAHPLSSSSVTPPPTSAPLAFGVGSFSGYLAASQASLCPWDSKTIPPPSWQKKVSPYTAQCLPGGQHHPPRRTAALDKTTEHPQCPVIFGSYAHRRGPRALQVLACPPGQLAPPPTRAPTPPSAVRRLCPRLWSHSRPFPPLGADSGVPPTTLLEGTPPHRPSASVSLI